MNILVTGSKGQLGRELNTVLEAKFPGSSTYIDIDELDLTDRRAVEEYMRSHEFTHVVNCAAYTDVERAEEEKLQCKAVNIEAVTNIARLADELGYRIIHISTDYEFDGTSSRPYTEGDQAHPLSEYGASKRKGVMALLGLAPESIVIRTGWLYSPYGRNFLLTMLRIGAERGGAEVVVDQVGTPTYARDLAEAIATILSWPRWVPGVYNYSNEGVASWYDFAVEIFDETGHSDWTVRPITTDQRPSAARRPHYSVLDKNRIRGTFGIEIRHWRHALADCLARMKETN